MKEKKLVLHIGQTKTGTTSIQNFLHINQKALESSDIHYAARPRQSISHRYLFHLVCSSVPKLQETDFCKKHFSILQDLFNDEKLNAIEDYWDFFKHSLLSNSYTVSIISEELLWELGKFEHSYKLEMIELLANKLNQIIPSQNITIVVALRHHAEWIESWHNQMVKDQGNQTRIKPFLEAEKQHGSLDYALNLEDWRMHFPGATFKVLDFKTSLVTPQPIGINFLREANLFNQLQLESVLNFAYPKPLQESIHPFLHAYIIRNKPAFEEISEYKIRLKKANRIVELMTKEANINHSFTLINPMISKICSNISEKDNLKLFGIDKLSSNLSAKKQVPKHIPEDINKKLDDLLIKSVNA